MATSKAKVRRKSVSLRKSNKIIKKIRDYRRKKRRERKKNPRRPRRKLIPVSNACPFKQDLLIEAENFRQLEKEAFLNSFKVAEEEKKEREAERLKQLKESKEKMREEEIKEKLKKQQEAVEQPELRSFKKVIDNADIILEVADARNPMGTRSDAIREYIEKVGNKKLILVLTKSDLVSQENIQKWLKYFRKSVPCVTFKNPEKKVKRRSLKIDANKEAKALINLLNGYIAKRKLTAPVRIGLVGLSHVGKRTIVKTLRKTYGVSGIVDDINESIWKVTLDSNIQLLVSCGVPDGDIWSKIFNYSDNSLSNERTKIIEMVADPIHKLDIAKLYQVSGYSGKPDLFLLEVAKRYGMLGRKGTPLIPSALTKVLEDWKSGLLKGCQEPPEDEARNISINKEVKEFDFRSYDKEVFESNKK